MAPRPKNVYLVLGAKSFLDHVQNFSNAVDEDHFDLLKEEFLKWRDLAGLSPQELEHCEVNGMAFSKQSRKEKEVGTLPYQLVKAKAALTQYWKDKGMPIDILLMSLCNKISDDGKTFFFGLIRSPADKSQMIETPVVNGRVAFIATRGPSNVQALLSKARLELFCQAFPPSEEMPKEILELCKLRGIPVPGVPDASTSKAPNSAVTEDKSEPQKDPKDPIPLPRDTNEGATASQPKRRATKKPKDTKGTRVSKKADTQKSDELVLSKRPVQQSSEAVDLDALDPMASPVLPKRNAKAKNAVAPKTDVNKGVGRDVPGPSAAQAGSSSKQKSMPSTEEHAETHDEDAETQAILTAMPPVDTSELQAPVRFDAMENDEPEDDESEDESIDIHIVTPSASDSDESDDDDGSEDSYE
jgi:hypothetical protein